MRKENKGIILAIILISYFMILLDNSIIFTGTVDCSRTQSKSNCIIMGIECLLTNV